MTKQRVIDGLKKAIHVAKLAVWIFEKVLNAIETFPNSDSNNGGGASTADVKEESKP